MIRSDGTLGPQFDCPCATALVASNGADAIAIIQEGPTILISKLDPASGFSDPQLLVHGARALDVTGRDGSFLVLVADDDTGATEAIEIEAGGKIEERAVLFEDLPIEDARIERAATGDQLLFSTREGQNVVRNTESGIYAVDLDRLPVEPLELKDATMISTTRFDFQLPLAFESSGEEGLAIWNETIDDVGHVGTFMRRVSSMGLPLGEPLPLPLLIGSSPDIAFDGQNYILVWSEHGIRSVVISSSSLEVAGAHQLAPSGQSPAVAAENGRRFAVWSDPSGTLKGTPLRPDGAAEVPGGFPTLPSFTASQSAPAIAALPRGFHLLWTEALPWLNEDIVQSAVISDSGNIQSLSTLEISSSRPISVAAGLRSSLASLTDQQGGFLYAFGGAAAPFEVFRPIGWGAWTPVSVVNLPAVAESGEEEYLVTLIRGGTPWAARVAMRGGFITASELIAPFGNLSINPSGTAVIQGNVIAVGSADRRVWTARPGAERRRAVRR
jgi:hypothetical protein